MIFSKDFSKEFSVSEILFDIGNFLGEFGVIIEPFKNRITHICSGIKYGLSVFKIFLFNKTIEVSKYFLQ